MFIDNYNNFQKLIKNTRNSKKVAFLLKFKTRVATGSCLPGIR